MSRSMHAHTSDALGFHLRELAENLDVRSFQALSLGLGIGDLKPKEQERIAFQVSQATQPEVGQVSQFPQTAAMPLTRRTEEPLSPPSQNHQQGQSKRRRLPFILHRLYAWTIDLSLVVISLGLALACAAAALSFGEGQENFWYDGGPLSWILKFRIVEVAMVVGGVFVMYLGVFKLIAGKTFGESLALGVEKTRLR